MFSEKEHCTYKNNQLVEVICQLRFPTILSIATKAPADFQDAIRETFPTYQLRHDAQPMKVTQAPGQPPRMERAVPVANHQFRSADGHYRVNLTQDFISLTCNQYTTWEDFAKMMDHSLASFIRLYKPASFTRAGLRYVNVFSRKELDLESVPMRELLTPAYMGLMSKEEMPETSFLRCTQEVDATIPGGCQLKLHIGPGMMRRGTDTSDKEVKLIFDMDVSMKGNIPVNLAAASMQTIHAQANNIFRDAITDTLHEAML